MFSLSSLSARYLLASLLVAILPLAATVIVYDRYTADLAIRLSGQRLDGIMAATASKLSDFLNSKSFQLEALAGLPQLTRLNEVDLTALDSRALTLLRFEADSPDIYAVWFLDRNDRVLATLPGQLVADPELREEAGGSLASLPRVELQGAELIGPMLPADGRPGWFLLRREIAGSTVSVALQVRLASLTEHLAGASLEAYRPVLHTPGGRLLSPVGIEWRGPAPSVHGPQIAPGWHPAMIQAAPVPAPGGSARSILIAVAAVCGGAIAFVFARLGARIRRRVAPLVAGAEAVARGELDLKLPVSGNDEIAKLSQALNRMSAQLRSLIRSHVETEKRAVLGEFAASVAHEVRNPLATIRTSVQALGAREEDAARRELLNLIVDEIERINGVIEGLLSFARPREPEITAVSARDLLRRVAALAGPMAEEAGVRLSVLGEPHLRLRVDAGHAQQIIINLILNGLQAMPQGGSLTLRAESDGAFGLISVSDTGQGMPPEIAAKVMEPFFTTKPGGTGLGLPISRQLAEMNGGGLEIASGPGSGTTVTLRLPLADGTA